jgi:hypothetical protein
MRNMHEAEFADTVHPSQMSLDGALSWHLRVNHKPAIPQAWIEPAKRAVEILQDAGPLLEDGVSSWENPSMLDTSIDITEVSKATGIGAP